MRAFAALLLAFGLAVLPMGAARSQTTATAPRGLEPIPGYSGLYVADANRFMVGAFLAIMLSRPKDVRAFLVKTETCASDRQLVLRLGSEGLKTSLVRFTEAFTAVRTGKCDIFIGRDFDFSQLDKRLDQNGGTTQPDRPRPPDDVGPVNPEVVDRTPPSITPSAKAFEGKGRTITVSARITDAQSGVRAAFIGTPDGGRLQMNAAQGSSIYSATVPLPRDFQPQTVMIVATDNVGLSNRAPVLLQLLPWCGPREVVSQTLVKNVQENLACVGISAGGTDGALGPNTCKAIGAYLRDRMPSFDAGRVPWTSLQAELDRACRAAQPVVLDVPGPIEVDSPQTRVRIGLRQAGLTQSIRIAGAEGGVQTQIWRGQPVAFDLPMPPPGQTTAYRVQALGPNGDSLDSAVLQLVRPSVLLSVRPSGTLDVETERTDFTVTITRGAAAIVRIEARGADANPSGTPYTGRPVTMSLPSPAPGSARSITFAALDRRGLTLAEQTVRLTRVAAVLPTRLSIESPDGATVDAATVRLRIALENRGAAEQVILRTGPNMAEIARRRFTGQIWDVTHASPPPGQSTVFNVQAVDGAGRLLAEDEVRVERPPVRMQVDPSGRVEADTDGLTVQVRVATGADWISAVVARSATSGANGPVLGQSALVQGQAPLRLEMPAPGNTQPVEIAAIGRDGKAYAVERITLSRPAVAAPPADPVSLLVTSPDGFAIDEDSTRLSVHIANPADTAVIVVTDGGTGQVLERVRYAGEDWLGQVAMPAPGRDRSLVVEAQTVTGETLARSQVMLIRPVVSDTEVPGWVWIGGLVLGALGLGYLGAKLGGRRGKDSAADVVMPPPRPRLYAKPDNEPSLGLEPSSPTTLALRIDEDPQPEIEIEFDQDTGAER